MLLFVYGTLLRGEDNAPRIAHLPFVGDDSTQAAFTLVNLGPYPGLVKGGGTAVKGELYDIQKEHLPALDEFEEHPHLYRRDTLLLASGRRAVTYFLNEQHARGAFVIPHGNWRLRSGNMDCADDGG